VYKKIRINLNIIKWCLTCCLLLGNLLLLAKNDDKLFIIIYEISINVLAIGSFILLSFFPRIYYIFDEYGISYQNKKGKEYLFSILKQIDPPTAEKLHCNDVKRVIRALEIYEISGKKKSDICDELKSKYEYLAVAIDFPRDEL